ncbi:MAG TPA: GerAB/ArcD/ProY family transporter [Paenibacillus sp.]|uniref:GerAB/ArcD/ProY family transporter n=1 Tax=Paenibacillus sp. TaxID=58172 RepID=UPI002C1F20BA|nr:GerAB/ArcD/ProY family transporter [Paenibacillus sp.]HUC93877.1 GerAB/ArcD/ProY family transporter [Paenibacillus sp.]
MEKTRISPKQLFALIMLFEFGTALVVPIGLAGRQDVWLSILLALIGGIGLFLAYDYLFRQYPDLPLSGYARQIVGKPVGWLLSLLYVPFFIYLAARDLRDAGDLLATSVFHRTPLFVISALMIVAVVYVLHKGIEVFARTGEIYLMVLIGLGVLGNIFVLFSGLIDLKNLHPLLAKGWRPVIKDAYPNIFMFPFGEMICFTTMLPSLNKRRSGRKTGVIALICSAVILSMTHAVEIAVLGSDMYGRAAFPLLTTISKVNIGDFLQRMDVIVILTLIIGNFFKIAVFCYAALIVACDLFKVNEQQKLVLPVGIVVLLTSMMIAGGWSQHIEEGRLTIKFLLPLFSVVIPALLLAVHLIRKRFGVYRPNMPADDKS